MQIMLRHAEDDFTARTTANAMMRVGAEVVSITDSGGPPYAKNIGRFIVWAKVRDDAHIAEVDASIDSSKASRRRQAGRLMAERRLYDSETTREDK